MRTECQRKSYYAILLSLLLASTFVLGGCTNPEKAKAEYLSKGDAYLKESKFQEASLEYRNALQIDDKLAAAHWGLARAYEGLQRFQETFDALRKTVELDPNNLEARVKLGNYYVAAASRRPETLAEAERLANEILQKDPNYIEGHILMGSVLFAQGHQDKAFAELNQAINLDPKRVESYLSLARFYIATKDQAKAEETYQRAISLNANSGLAHTEYGRFLAQANRTDEAENELRKAVEVEPSNRGSRLMLAGFYLVNKQLDKAEEAYKALAALDPDKPESQAVLADFYSSVNRLDEAVRTYQEILSKSPQFKQGRYRLGEILLNKGDHQGTMAQVDEVLKSDQTDRQALLLRARVRATGGQPENLKAAIEDLKEVLRQEPDSRPGLYFMAQMNLGLGLLDQARAFAGDLERKYPDYAPVKLMQVQIALASNEPKLAASLATELLNRLERVAPDRDNSPQMLSEIRAKTYLVRGMAQGQLRNLNAARQDFLAARDIAPNSTDVYNNLAALAKAERKTEEAVGFYENSLAIDPLNGTALGGLIDLYARENELAKAHERLDQLLNSNPNNANLYYLKAQAYGFEKNSQAAESALRKTIELDPNNIAAYSALGALFINTKQEERAIAEYKRIIELRPDNASAYTVVGMLEDARQNYAVAAENYRKALEKDPNSSIAANNLAWMYAIRKELNGNLDEAVRLAQGVVQRNPNVAGFIDTLGWVYYHKGLHAAAVDQLQKAVSVDEAAARATGRSPSGNYRYHLGMALKASGDRTAAKRELELAMRLAEKAPFPDVEEARKALATL
ncbi:MAG TPA: tetratricopeptide repeat protein [Pyrinomonadaceae bacterium]|nr:tetratricopeptide repeat protein [Pyrinomonadaceae bacterium]